MRYVVLNATKSATTDEDVKRTYVLRIDKSLHYFTFNFVFFFLPCIMPHVFIFLFCIMCHLLVLYMSNIFVISHVLTQVFKILQDGASVPAPRGGIP
jgi:hypothetical protein